MEPDHRLDAEILLDLFAEVDSELGEQAEPVTVLIVGGAAIALQWGNRTTYDVDVVSEGMTPELRTAVARVGHRWGLPADWLNDAAKAKSASPDIGVDPQPLYIGAAFNVYGSDARYLLAMKLMSRRPVDQADLQVLLDETDMSSKEDLLDLVQQAYPHHTIPVAVQYSIDDALRQHRHRANQPGRGDRRQPPPSAGQGLGLDL